MDTDEEPLPITNVVICVKWISFWSGDNNWLKF